MTKRIISILLCLLLLFNFSCSSTNNYIGKIYILNFGEYLDPKVIKTFENETGIQVIEDVAETNEEMLPTIQNGTQYDCVCCSDYLIERMSKLDLLEPINKSLITNYDNLMEDKLNFLKECDPDNKYSIPYFYGDFGIVYNKTWFNANNIPEPTKWADLWDKRLEGNLLMQSSIRDLYCAGLLKNGYSSNSTDINEINNVTEDLIKQKPLVQAYLCDLIVDKIVSGEATIGTIYSGDMQRILSEGDDEYVYVVPEEGTGLFIDAWCIPKNCNNYNYAHQFIDFLLRKDIVRLNNDFVGYQSVNKQCPDKDYLLMFQFEGAYKNFSNNNIPERDIGEAIRYYTDGYNKIKGN